MTKILIIGASGMLGSTLLRYFSLKDDTYICYGTIRSIESIKGIKNIDQLNLLKNIDALDLISLKKVFEEIKPNIVINCIGIIKQLEASQDMVECLKINSLFPHQLASICLEFNSRLIHLSTDCVFSGKKGMYKESDLPDAQDIYGLTKRLGEVEYDHSITIRTSIIGHELQSNKSLLNWFLSQKDCIEGYKNAIFSGLPTLEIAKIIDEFIIPNNSIKGLHHVSAEPINKYRLLSIIKEVYQKEIEIKENNKYIIDKSLDSAIFRNLTGYAPKDWKLLIKEMNTFG